MRLSAKAKKKLETNPALFIEQEIKQFFHTSPDNHLSFFNDYTIWDEPLVGFADGDDSLFS